VSNLNPPTRKRLLLALAAGCGLWSAWIVFKPADVVAPEGARRTRAAAIPGHAAPTLRAHTSSATPARQAAAHTLELRNTVAMTAESDPFSAKPWVVKREPPKAAAPAIVVAPPPVVVAPEPPAPPPLQLPYRYLGTYAEKSGPPSIFLALGDRVIVAKLGDTVEGGFRLDAATNRELTFVHIQQNATLRLSVTGGSL
jgi:hypothetical protein